MTDVVIIALIILIGVVALSLAAFTTCMCIDIAKSWRKDRSK